MEPIHKKSTVDLAVEKLTEYIRSENIQIGQKLPAETALCKELNISRTTVREAHRVLQSQGYLELRAGKGAFVKSKERDFIQEAAEWISSHRVQSSDYLAVRLALEPLSVRLAAEKATEKDIEDLNQIHNNFVRAFEKKDSETLSLLDAEFHSRISKISDNDLLISLMQIVNYHFTVLRQNSFRVEQHAEHAIEPHRNILNAIANKQPEQAVKACIEHTMLAYDDLCGWRPEHKG